MDVRKQLAQARVNLLQGRPDAAARTLSDVFSASDSLTPFDVFSGAYLLTPREIEELLVTCAEVLWSLWASGLREAASELVEQLPRTMRPSIGLIAARSGLGSLFAHPTQEAYDGVVAASEFVASCVAIDSYESALALWYGAEAGRAMGDPQWPDRLESACAHLSSELERDGPDSRDPFLPDRLSDSYARLSEHYTAAGQLYEAAGKMKLAVQYSRDSGSSALPRRLAELAILEGQTRENDAARGHALESLGLLENIAEPTEDYLGTVNLLLRARGLLGYSEADRLLEAASEMGMKARPTNEVAWSLSAVAGVYEARGSWDDAARVWAKVGELAAELQIEGVLGLPASLGMIRSLIELGDTCAARTHLDRAFELLELWPNPEARQSLNLYRAVLSHP